MRRALALLLGASLPLTDVLPAAAQTVRAARPVAPAAGLVLPAFDLPSSAARLDLALPSFSLDPSPGAWDAPALSSELSVQLRPALETLPAQAAAPRFAPAARLLPAARRDGRLEDRQLERFLTRIGWNKSAPSDAVDAAGAEPALAPAPAFASARMAAPTPDPMDRTAQKKANVRNYLIGTSIFKVGMEALGLAVPLIALSATGQVSWAAALAMGYFSAQIVFSSFSGGLLDRYKPVKVLAWSMRLHAGAVAGILGLFAAGAASPWLILPLYTLAGGFFGVFDTARQVVPPAVIGRRKADVRAFNAKTHIAYQIAGVAGAFGLAFLISQVGLIPALMVHPPAYILASFLFSRIRLSQADERRAVQAAEPELPGSGGPAFFKDLKTGAKLVLGNAALRWSMIAIALPLALHRLLESLLIPVFAADFLSDPSKAGLIIGASNAGELLGGFLLLRMAFETTKGKRSWTKITVRLMALGLVGLWAFIAGLPLWMLMVIVGFGSMGWAASDQIVRAELQAGLSDGQRGRAFGFIQSVSYAIVLATTMGLGFLFDHLPKTGVFWGVSAAVTLLVPLLWIAAARAFRAPKADIQEESPDDR